MDTLEKLLARIDPGPSDELWLVGDLVNRGPRSLDVLRWARAHESRVRVVLGNHDVHLLARAAGLRDASRRDTLDDVLAAPDRDTLLDWLRTRPLLYRRGDRVMVHAGLRPEWSVDEAERRARAVEAALRGPHLGVLLDPESALGRDLRALTTLRMLDEAGGLSPHDGPPDEAPPGHRPWFAAPGRRSRDATIVFGHWSALGLYLGEGCVGLDTGCVWGRALTAVQLDDLRVVQEPSAEVP